MSDEFVSDAFETQEETSEETAEETPETEEVQASDDVALVRELISELKTNPSAALDLVQSLSKITKPWEPISNLTTTTNEMTVPPGQNPNDFRHSFSSHVSGFKLTTIFGDEVASIIRQTPKWKVFIEGQPQTGVPFVSHSKKAESDTKKFVEEILTARGYIIG